MGNSCCGELDDSKKPKVQGVMDPKMKKRKYNTKYIYTVSFKSKPLRVSIATDKNGEGAYIVSVGTNSPADVDIELNSRVLAINGKDIKGLHLDTIFHIIKDESVPVTMTMVQSAGLNSGECPDPYPNMWRRNKNSSGTGNVVLYYYRMSYIFAS